MELHDAKEAMGMRKVLADTGMKKNPQTKEDTSWIFTDFQGVMRLQSPTCTPHGNFINGVGNPKIVYMLLLFQIICIDWFFLKKTLTLTENSLNFNGT